MASGEWRDTDQKSRGCRVRTLLMESNILLRDACWITPPAPCKPNVPLERQLQCQLNRPGATDLVQRVEAPVESARPQALGEHLCRLPKRPLIHNRIGITKIRMIEDVKQLKPGL